MKDALLSTARSHVANARQDVKTAKNRERIAASRNEEAQSKASQARRALDAYDIETRVLEELRQQVDLRLEL